MLNIIKIVKRVKEKRKDSNTNLLPSANFKFINDNFLLENISTHKYYSDTINSYNLWDNFTFDQELGSMEFSNSVEGFALALDKESLYQIESIIRLNNQLTIFTKVLINGSIIVNIYSNEFKQIYKCSSIKWFKKE